MAQSSYNIVGGIHHVILVVSCFARERVGGDVVRRWEEEKWWEGGRRSGERVVAQGSCTCSVGGCEFTSSIFYAQCL